MKHLYTTTFLVLLFLQNFAQTPGEIGPLTSIDSYTTFEGYEEAQAHLGQGEYQIYYDNIDGVLDKPLIICDGYDPDNSNSIDDIYNRLTYNDPPQFYIEELRDMGIDVIILNFPTYVRPSDGATINGGGDYIERNGLVFVNLIETIKNEQVGDNEFVIVGPSMGGLVTRYALTYMEQNALDHNSGLWVSFDSPHRGANVSISFQYAINYIGEVTEDADMLAMRDVMLNSPAAQQLLLDHYKMHLQDGSPFIQDITKQLPTPHDFRTTFMATMDTYGFPVATRNVSIINGSLNGSMVESPGAEILNDSFDLGGGLGADVILHFTPDTGISDFEIDYIQPTLGGIPFGLAFYAYAESPSYTAGLDSAPGGSILFESFFGADPSPLEQQVIDALQVEAFSFIPSLSSVSIDEPDWYASIDGTETMPFDDYLGGIDNEPHLTLNQEYVDFLNNEIANILLGADDVSFARSIDLLTNPATENISILCVDQNNYTISIINTTGQLIASYKLESDKGLVTIPCPTTDGLYYLHISDTNHHTIKKVIVQQ